MSPSKLNDVSAIGVMTSFLGIICGISGFEHGFFEILQGNISPEGRMINAIGEANRFWQYGTEPAFTLIPNFFITGIVAMLVSLAVIIWAAIFVPKNRYGGVIFILLSILQFLVGGGLPQTGLALIIGIVALWHNRPLTWGWELLPVGLRRVLATPWPWLVIALALIFTTTIVGAIFGVLPGVTDPNLVSKLLYDLLYVMEGLLPLMVISVLAHDSLRVADN
jgi:hypothetical protein